MRRNIKLLSPLALYFTSLSRLLLKNEHRGWEKHFQRLSLGFMCSRRSWWIALCWASGRSVWGREGLCEARLSLQDIFFRKGHDGLVEAEFSSASHFLHAILHLLRYITSLFFIPDEALQEEFNTHYMHGRKYVDAHSN